MPACSRTTGDCMMPWLLITQPSPRDQAALTSALVTAPQSKAVSSLRCATAVQNAVFETQYKAEEGKQFFLAFSEGGPLTYTAQAVQTSTKMNNLLKKLVTTVIISTAITKEDVESLRKAFQTGNLTAFRIFFANNMTFEGDVKDKKSMKVKQKVECFGDFFDKNS